MMDSRERLEDLLVARATEGLGDKESRELDDLLAAHPDVDPDGFDLAATALHLAFLPDAEPMPDLLRETLVSEGMGQPASAAPRSRPRTSAPRRAPWVAVAMVAAVVVAFLGGRWMAQGPTLPDPGAGRATLLAEASDLVTISWTATEDPSAQGTSGDVVWSPSRQEGYMRFRGLESNDPTLRQYQLWVFDATRDDRFPVDGGVFDIPADADEVIVPIRTPIEVRDVNLFAVTVERPGGVVVSDRERIVVVAQPTQG